jgi:hypothetical protein
MTNSRQCREYAKDCIRIAQNMDVEDKEKLLKIAEAWEMRAIELEKKEKAYREDDRSTLPFGSEEH